jgi:hypothetical protein
MNRALVHLRLALPPVVALGVLLAIPSPAFADNCSSLSDCWGTAAGAASAAAGAAGGVIGGLFGGGGSGGGNGGRGAPPTGAAPDAPDEPAAPDEPVTRDEPVTPRAPNRPPRTADDDLFPDLDLDEETRKMHEENTRYWEDWEKRHGTDRAQRG